MPKILYRSLKRWLDAAKQCVPIYQLDGKYSGRVQLPAKAIADCHHNGGCAVNGTAVSAVLIDQSRSFMNLHMRYVYWIAARLPICKIWGFCRQHLATLAIPTIRSIKRK